MATGQVALGLVVVGVVLIVHALGRCDRASFENGSFLFVILEGLFGAGCLLAAMAVVISKILIQ